MPMIMAMTKELVRAEHKGGDMSAGVKSTKRQALRGPITTADTCTVLRTLKQ